jgi:hypothetical protein
MVRVLIPVVCLVAAVLLLTTVAYAQDEPVRIDVKEDVYVRSSMADRNFSRSKELYAGAYFTQIYRSFLRFGLAPLAEAGTVEKATLFVWHRFGSATSAPDISVYTAGNGWVEDEITWEKAPPISEEACDTVRLVANYTQYEWDVTKAVKTAAESDEEFVTLVLGEAPGVTADAWARLYGKGEQAGRDPYLMVECGAVVERDTTPPTMDFTALKDRLWPPNHKMVLCATLSDVTDDRDPEPNVDIIVTSDEPINGKGDGNTDPDWEVIQNGDVQEVWLRAERSGTGDGRTYEIKVVATDAAGNAASELASIAVEAPHSQGGETEKGKK